MLDRFDDQARSVVRLAEEEARRLGHPYVGTEHLLLGVVVEGSGAAASAAERAGASVAATRSKVAEAVGKGAPSADGTDLPFSSRATRALERASRRALQEEADGRVLPGHVLVAVLSVEGRAGQVLRGLGVDTERLRLAVEAADEGPARSASSAEATEEPRRASGPRCPACHAFLESSLSHRVLRSDGEGRQHRNLVAAYCGACGETVGVFPG